MNHHRIVAMIWRYTLNLKHSLDRLTDMFYWPVMELSIWGLTGSYIAKVAGPTSSFLFIIVSGLVFWIVVWRAQYEITTNLLSEIWDRNLVNIFASPLKLSEWMAAFMIFGLLKSLISFTFSAMVAYLLFKYNIFIYGFLILPFAFSLLLTGWVGGFIVASFLIRFGQKIQTLAWAGIALIMPFSAVFYPVTVLPEFAQKIALGVPSTYVFEGIREILLSGHFSPDKLLVSFALNIFYLILAIWFFVWMFHQSRKLGLGRLI